MNWQQVTYPGVELKRHPRATSAMASRGCADRLTPYPTDEQIAREILDTYLTMRDSSRLSTPSGEWRWIFGEKHRQYQAVLESGDAEELATLLRNFFRNDLSFGLVSHSTFESLKEGDEDVLLEFANSMLLDLDTWSEFCDSPPVATLEMPAVGNPYGIVVEDTLITPDVCRHSYHARKLKQLMVHCAERPTILEIGGGYGGVFRRLWADARDWPRFCYINCDLEESLFLFYYFALTNAASRGPEKVTQPRLKWATDGVITKRDTQEYDLILVPASLYNAIDCGVDIAYNAHSLSEMAREDIDNYFRMINRNNPRFIYHQNSNFFPWKESSRGHIEVLARYFPIDRSVYEEVYRAVSPWMGAHGRYREYLYVHKDAAV